MKKKDVVMGVICVMLALQGLIILLLLAYAFLGTYADNHASNIWAWIGSHGLLPAQILVNPLAIITGIIGLIKKGGDQKKGILSILLLVSFFVSLLCLFLSIGRHF